MSKEALHLYGEIEKFDSAEDGSLLVSGIASTECVDADGEVVTAEAMRKALPSYLQSGTVREMHGPIAAGRPISAFVDDDGKTHFTAKIVDAGTVAKIKEKVLKGFSIGGKAIQRVGNKITEIILKDISVVDLPNNPQAFFTVIKFEQIPVAEPKDDMSAELLQKYETLNKSVETLNKTLETMGNTVKTQNEALEKMRLENERLNAEARAVVEKKERADIIAKMDAEGRCPINPETGKAFSLDELQKADMTILKFAAVNAPKVPMQARAIFKRETEPKAGEGLKGRDKTEAIWTQKYDSLATLRKMDGATN